jgi:hypothetical protein
VPARDIQKNKPEETGASFCTPDENDALDPWLLRQAVHVEVQVYAQADEEGANLMDAEKGFVECVPYRRE